MPELTDYKSPAENQWCPGCPNFGILTALKRALAALDRAPHEVCLVSGIGQAAKLPHYLKCNFFNGLHGRALPVATGIKIANPDLTTIVTTGDGDCYGEGGNHFLHALRRNPDITVIVHDNRVYALTKGQASPRPRWAPVPGSSSPGWGRTRSRGSLPRSSITPRSSPVGSLGILTN